MIRQRHILRRIVLFVVEHLLIVLSTLAAIIIRTGGYLTAMFRYEHLIGKVILLTGICQLSLYYCDLYDSKVIKNFRELYLRLLQGLGLASIILGVIYTFFPSLIITNRVFIFSAGIFYILAIGWRLFYGWVLRRARFSENLLILGNSPLTKDIINEVKERRYSGYNIVGVVSDNLNKKSADFPEIYRMEELPRILQEKQIHRVIVNLSEQRGSLPITDLLEWKIRGIQIETGVLFYEHLAGKIMISELRPSDLVFTDGFRQSELTKFIKRMTGIIFSVIGLVLASPIMVLTAIAIKVDSRGPVLFRQERVGQGSKVFKLLKFRSMVVDAEESSGPVWAEKGDSRATRVGRFIRKFRIDELPQMINVVKGEMSFVGPRPERAFFVQELKKRVPFYIQRLAVKPGITGLAQVRYPYGATEEDAVEKLQYDLYYVKHMSFILDLLIVIDTVKVIIFGKGAR